MFTPVSQWHSIWHCSNWFC